MSARRPEAVDARGRYVPEAGGALVGVPALTTAGASITNTLAGVSSLDQTPSYPQGNTYTVTVQQGAASGNGTMQQVTVSAAPVVNSFTG